MILQSLYALYERLSGDPDYDLVEPGFSPQKIAFKIVLHPDGRLYKIEDARTPDKKGQMLPARLRVLGEAKPSGAGINPCFLWDNQTYLLGRQPEDKPAGFGQKRFEAFRERHLLLEKELALPSFSAVCRFLKRWDSSQIAEHPILEEVGTGFGVFQMLGEPAPVHEEPKILNWWKASLASKEADAKGELGQCLLTGEVSKIAALHPKIKGVPGAQAAGASLVSFNDTAYESYGKSQGYISPVSEEAAFRYGAALNNLLSGPQSAKHRIRIGDTTCVFWTDKPSITEDIFAAIATGGDRAEVEAQDPAIQEKIHRFLKALQQGRAAYGDLGDDPDATRFYLLGLAPNAARLSVRFFYQSTLGELLDHLHQHQRDIAIVREYEQSAKGFPDPIFPAYWEFLRETVRKGDDPSPLLGGALMRAILEGTPYPEALFTGVLRRVQIERHVNYLRAAAIKAVLTRNHQLEIPYMLDTNKTDPAYLLGRLFAVLEKIQEEGAREQTGRTLEKTIRDTYFASACGTPASVFPRLETLSTHHRRHLNPGRKVQFDQLVSEIKWPQSGGPKRTHTLEEQGLFILGYYHQRKALFTRKEEAAPAVA